MTKVLNALVIVIALLLGLVCVQAAADPVGFMAQYGFAGAQPKGISEIRCFFGGNFLTYAVVIVAGLLKPALRRGAWVAVGIAMTLIGLLRIVAIVTDGAMEFNAFALVVELLFAAILFLASRNAGPRLAATV